MAFAAVILSELCDRLDDGEDPSAAFLQAFQETKLDLADAVDRRIAFAGWLEGAIFAAKKARDAYAERARKLGQVEEAFKKNTAETIQAHPDLPYKGALGRLAVQASAPSLKLSFEPGNLTLQGFVDLGIDTKFIISKTTWSLDTAAVKAALVAGEQFSWASLEHGKHLRVKRT